MKTKIIATVMALGMVLMAFSMFATAGTPETGLSRTNPAADGQQASLVGNIANGISYYWEQAEAFTPSVSVCTVGVNSKGIAIDGPGTWTYNALYTQASADMGSIWDAWATGENYVQVYEVFNDQSASGRNYTMIFEDVVEGDGSTNAGANTVQNALTLINNPTLVSVDKPTTTAVISIAAQVTGYETPSLYDGYGLYKSTTGPITGSNPGTFVADITTGYTDTAWTMDSWYAVKVKWDGSSTGAFFAPRYSYGYSQYLFADWVDAANAAPVVTLPATAPAVHNGNTVTEFVTITATITDADAADTLSATYSVDGGAPVAFAQTGVSPLAVSAVYNFPSPFTEGPHTVSIIANDGTVDSAAGAAPFTVTDTTAPLAAWGTVPGATAFWTNDLVFTASYTDFSDRQLAGSYLTWSLNAVPQANIPFVMTFDGFGSYLYTATATIVGGTLAAGDVVTYGGQVTAASATPQTTILAAGGPITMQDPPVLTDPFPVFGAVVLYDGAAGVYSPNAAPINTPVTVEYFDFALGANRVMNTVTDASGFYTVDIMNAVVADPFGIEVQAGPFPGYGNMGYNWVAVVPAYAVGGVQVDVTCGIPYEVVITAPLTGSNVIAGTGFPVTYVFYDIDGVLAQGYYTYADGPMLWTSSEPLFVAPAARTFNGIATATPGTATDTLTLWTPLSQTIRIAENGLANDNFLTPWDNFGPVQIGGVSTPVFLDDWDEITLNILGNSFEWNVVDGWNIVSVPMDPVIKGLNGVFDGADALAECNAQFPDPTLALAMRDNLGVYTVIDLSTTEAAAFVMDGVHGYWVFSATPGIVNFLALDYVAVGVNVVNAVAGWNLLGFTHNFGVGTWNVAGNLDADYLTTALPGVAMTTKIVATSWDYTAQWYYSYVVTPTFVMPSRNWNWDFSYSPMPGNGFYLWLDAAAVITFPMNY